jgi:hypothetical protein
VLSYYQNTKLPTLKAAKNKGKGDIMKTLLKNPIFAIFLWEAL